MTDLPGRKVRLGVINTHPIQYVAPLLRRLNETSDIEVVPIYLTDFSLRGAVDPQFGRKVVWDIDLLAGTIPVFVPGFQTRKLAAGAFAMPAPAVWNIVRGLRLDSLLIFGHVQLANHIALLAAKSQGIPVFYRGETHLQLERSGASRVARRLLMGSYYKLFDGFLAIGTLNRLFYLAMGVPERKIFWAPYAVDNERMVQSAALSPSARADLRHSLGARNDVPLLVYASKLTRRKHPDNVLEAAQILRREGLDFDLLFVGTGEMEAFLREASQDVPGAAPIFAGFKNQSELPSVMGSADIFILPSENEPWGLIINEAMCAGLVIVTTHEVGSVPDLVKDGDNGRLYPAGDVAALVDVLRPLIADPALTARMGEESRRIIAKWGYAEDIEGIRAALRATGRLSAI